LPGTRKRGGSSHEEEGGEKATKKGKCRQEDGLASIVGPARSRKEVIVPMATKKAKKAKPAKKAKKK
jgi:hypothetical protein